MSSLAVMRPPFLVVSDLRPPGDPRNPCGAGLVSDLGGGTSGDGRKQRETSLREIAASNPTRDEYRKG